MGLKEKLQALASRHATQVTQAVRDENATQFPDENCRLQPGPCTSSPLMSSFTFGMGSSACSPVGKRPKMEPAGNLLLDSSFSFGLDGNDDEIGGGNGDENDGENGDGIGIDIGNDTDIDIGIGIGIDMNDILKATDTKIQAQVSEAPIRPLPMDNPTKIFTSEMESTFEPTILGPNRVRQKSRLRDVFMEEDDSPVTSGAVPIISLTQSSTTFPPSRRTVPDIKAAGMLRALPVVMMPETFHVSQLQENMRRIALQVSNLILTGVPESSGAKVYKITEIVGLLVRDFRLIGGIAQLKCVDFEGHEHQASLSLDILTTLKFKLHFGMTLILTNISVFSPAPRLRYLNITLNNILAVYENVGGGMMLGALGMSSSVLDRSKWKSRDGHFAREETKLVSS